MINERMQKVLDENGYFEAREIEGQGICALQMFIYTVGIVCGIDEVGRRYRYCYPNLLEAKTAFQEWDGQGHPTGKWIKRKGEGGDILNTRNIVEIF